MGRIGNIPAMAKVYRVTTMRRVFNRMAMLMARRGMGSAVVLTTTGARSGRDRTVPVAPIISEGHEYLVAPYGTVGWVVNARENPSAALRRGEESRRVVLTEVTDDAAPIVAAYYEREDFSRPYMDVPENPTIDDFAAIAERFPVFRVDPVR